MERGGVRQLLVRLWWRLRQKSIVGDKPPLHQQPGTEVNGRDTPSNPEVLEARLPMGLGSAMSRATNAILTPHVAEGIPTLRLIPSISSCGKQMAAVANS